MQDYYRFKNWLKLW